VERADRLRWHRRDGGRLPTSFRPGAEDLATPRQPVRHEVV